MRRTRLLGLAGFMAAITLGAAMVAAAAPAAAVPGVASVHQAAAADHSLTSVACTGTSNCWAVGDYGENDVLYSSLAERWNGARWRVWKSPNPTNATALTGVTCVTASDCWAVGFASSGPPSDNDSPVAEYWDGHDWQASTPLSPSAFSSFDAVACSSRTSCWDVGSSSGLALIERWVLVTHTGPEWLVDVTPNPAGAERSSLDSVSCVSSSDCWAVGYYTTSSGVDATLAEHWNGSGWSLKAMPHPSKSSDSFIDGIACTRRTNCWAIGYYTTSSDLDKTLAEHWNGTKWQVKPTPNPSRSRLGVLNGVACNGPTNCTAIGYSGRGSDIVTLAEQWNGTKWQVRRTPDRSGPTLSELNGIACLGSSECWAVGDSGETQHTPSRTLAEYRMRTKWALVPTPDP